MYKRQIFGLLDVIIVIGLGVGVHVAKSRACAVVLLVYSVFNMIYMLLLAGMPGGWLILVCGIYATIYTFKYQSAWQRYQQTGRL